MSQIKRFSEPRALCKKERQRWSSFFSSNHHGRGLRTSVSRIFFFGDNFFLHVGGIFSWSFWLFLTWFGLYCAAHIYHFVNSVSLCNVVGATFLARRRHRTSVSRNFCAANFYFFSWNILDFPSFFLVLTCREEAIHMISVEISSTRNDVRIPALNAEPLAGKSGSKGVDAETNIKIRAYF